MDGLRTREPVTGPGTADPDPDPARPDPADPDPAGVGAPAGETFDGFFAAHSARLVGQVYAVTGDLAEAQDCLQEAFARAWLRWSTVSRHPDPAGWVRLTAIRLATSRFRRVWAGRRAVARLGTPPPAEEPSPDTVAVVDALRRIPAEQRVAIVLHHLVGLSVEQVASQTDTPTGTVKARLSRGRAALARLLSEEAEHA
jgi:RNA polymerase sigma-70 factor (ECF subfamily)